MRPKEPLSEASVRGVTSLQMPIFSSSTTPAEELRLIREVFHLDPAGIYEDAPAEGK